MKIKSLVFTYLLTANSTVTKMVATMSLKSLIKAAMQTYVGRPLYFARCNISHSSSSIVVVVQISDVFTS